jgi:hypothetical protein
VLPDHDRFLLALAHHQRRLRLAAVVWAFIAGAIATAATTVALSVSSLQARPLRWASVAAGTAVFVSLATRWWRSWSAARVANTIESRVTGLDNLVITAEEVIRATRYDPVPNLRDVLLHQAVHRLDEVAVPKVQALLPSVVSAAVAVGIAIILLTITGRTANTQLGTDAGVTSPTFAPSGFDLRVVITPPAYTERRPREFLNPSELTVLEGTTLRLETARDSGSTRVLEGGRPPVSFAAAADRWVHEFTVRDSTVLLLRRDASVGQGGGDRLLQVRVEPDRRPVVQILAPAKDLVFGEPKAKVPIAIEARDDVRLGTLTLRYTKVTGSGETFSFEEGEVPVRVRAATPGEWRGEAELSLETLKLADGDTLVYRAVATDLKPGADPTMSDTFLIEIGRLAAVASTGFAVEEDRDRQALSQQMLIIKTERLHAVRDSIPSEAFQEQARLLAVEQRMVKAEFVFMTGGEVADEIAEAEHAHELVEGRFENAAQVELLTAIREMARAEARLNAADSAQALTYERAALRALQRAFDRRRYLLRTLPERARIDFERRLSGDVSAVRPADRPHTPNERDPTIASARRVMAALEKAIAQPGSLGASLASEALAVAPSSEVLQRASIAVASASELNDRVEAARVAHRALTEIVRQRLAAAPQLEILDDPVRGRFADEVRRLRP